MHLAHALRLSTTSRLAFVGAGGKTTALFLAARQMKIPPLLTATTHLAISQVQLADRHWIIQDSDDLPESNEIDPQEIHLFTGPALGDGRTQGLDAGSLTGVYRIAGELERTLLVEADGSRRLPLKAPAQHEPAIPEFVNTVVVVAGLSALGKPLSSEWVHRPELFAACSGLALDAEITPDALARAFLHPNCGLKNIPSGARRILLLNQADTPLQQAQAERIAGACSGSYSSIVIAHLAAVHVRSLPLSETGLPGVKPIDSDQSILAVHENTAGVILAGGESKRFGQPKQLLIWQGEPFVRCVARKALEAGLHPVMVVTGASAEEVSSVLQDLPVQIIYNPAWKQGQSTSLKAGMAYLPYECGAAIFLHVDQPQVPVELLRQLQEAHAFSLSPLIAPLIDGNRATPVLFDRLTFDDLDRVEGDQGGRALFSRYPVEWVPWLDARVRLDIDYPEDLERLQQLYE